MNMDNDSDIFGVKMPQKILQTISQDDYAAIDYPFSLASNNSSSDFVEVISCFTKSSGCKPDIWFSSNKKMLTSKQIF